jgi:Protein of unknown function (DUF2442)
MNISAPEFNLPRATSVSATPESLTIELSDGRTLTVPLAWYPRLLHANATERGHWRLIGGGEGITWPDIEEDISVESLIAGRPSRESQASFRRWLDARKGK